MDLPSTEAARALARGEPGALPRVLFWTTFRAGLIGAGLVFAGQRQGVLRGAFAAAAVIELWVLAWAARDVQVAPTARALPQGSP